jgi:hypothetical protein
MDDEIFLNDVWNVYFHDPLDIDWTIPSYIRLSNVSSVEQYWENMNCLKPQVHKGIFFIMREHVFPCWDDINNINGGCLSIKILKEHLPEFWEDLTIKLLGECLLKEEKKDLWDIVNGISTSPKKHFCIIKIWLKNDSLANKEFFNIPQKYYGDILYRSNIENIHNDSTINIPKENLDNKL